MIRNVLVANRGEVACRVFRTCRELGIATTAVYADPDAGALHTRDADTAVRLPGAAAADTYLRGDRLVRAALDAGADAVHPGYGFLAENADFARAVTRAGLVWIGPPPEAMEAMASKTRAKRIAAQAGVPVLREIDLGAVAAADLPLLLKAVAGGGGHGMRVVREPDDLEEELRAAREGALAAFGSDDVFAEPCVDGARHVEVQLLADTHGTVWTLGTRDCSVQRRHQKLIEEAPAVGLPEGLEDQLLDAAEAVAREVGYVGAGTVEFLVARDGRAFFLEMNTRLQVEHPVTERVHGVDLVAHQIRVAEGHPLPPNPPPPAGHAVEARLYAEDPARDWAPVTGTVHRLHVDTRGPVRLDAGVGDGDTVSVYYDALLAKVTTWAPTRTEAVRALAYALERARIHGPATNREMLVRALRHPEFTAGPVDTGFCARNVADLTGTAGSRDRRLAALAAALADAHGRSRFGGFRNLRSQPQVKRYRSEPDGEEIEVRYAVERDRSVADGVRLLEALPEGVVLEVDGIRKQLAVAAYDGGRTYDGGRLSEGGRTPDSGRTYVDGRPGAWTFTALPRLPEPAARTEPGSLTAPLPGTVARIADGVAVGEPVTAGQPLLWLEAMKMEHRVVAPANGVLAALHAAPGQQVEVGTLLAVVEEPQ
ncbi:biotin carboxylase N-terminal domain-containing protein [Streptomyces gamaensis]|uniref:Biotin carboxylase N-terminal domain-containing protein n=1 Tax=Streptomyces gamaensis TaxID=1763542 RepID=A0ABW0Z6S7_9ACTN